MNSWAFWFALAALVVGAGKFLDNYHVRATTRTRVRNVLVRGFIWLDDKKVPDLGGTLLKLFQYFSTVRRLFQIFGLVIFGYFATLTAFYIGRGIFGLPNDAPYFSYILGWLPLNASGLFWLAFLLTILIPSIAGLFVMTHFFHNASLSAHDIGRTGNLIVGIIVGLGIAFLGTVFF